MPVAYALKEVLLQPAMANNAGVPNALVNALPCPATHPSNDRTTATPAAGTRATPPSGSCDMQAR
ncbi:hypothetical protein IA54_013510 [Xanthomonas phaseoli pv. syngonii LMG 9055]|uniref:Uncharacterized protein n=1 Tax=Xanthomonas phaseoli pv. syngonii LMG 9055 TaxID=1437878 RepID=A0A1V9GSB8_9XANT|nr:hypothetical protein IA54_013510 [Xanthomonas phaseoli pv. syngonii LMG 9055]